MYSNADTEWSEATGHFSGIHQEFQWFTLLPAYKLSLMSPITNSMAYIIVLIYISLPLCVDDFDIRRLVILFPSNWNHLKDSTAFVFCNEECLIKSFM